MEYNREMGDSFFNAVPISTFDREDYLKDKVEDNGRKPFIPWKNYQSFRYSNICNDEKKDVYAFDGEEVEPRRNYYGSDLLWDKRVEEKKKIDRFLEEKRRREEKEEEDNKRRKMIRDNKDRRVPPTVSPPSNRLPDYGFDSGLLATIPHLVDLEKRYGERYGFGPKPIDTKKTDSPSEPGSSNNRTRVNTFRVPTNVNRHQEIMSKFQSQSRSKNIVDRFQPYKKFSMANARSNCG